MPDKMKCANCGAPIEPTAAFCPSCGARVSAAVPQPQAARTSPAEIAADEKAVRDQKAKTIGCGVALVILLICVGIWAVGKVTGGDDDQNQALVMNGGLGLTRAQWEKDHGKGSTTESTLVRYDDDAFIVNYWAGSTIWHLTWNVPVGTSFEDARLLSRQLVPSDWEQVEATVAPSGMQMDVAFSKSLANKYDTSDADPWLDDKPGTFVLIYYVYDGEVSSVLIAAGNNP